MNEVVISTANSSHVSNENSFHKMPSLQVAMPAVPPSIHRKGKDNILSFSKPIYLCIIVLYFIIILSVIIQATLQTQQKSNMERLHRQSSDISSLGAIPKNKQIFRSFTVPQDEHHKNPQDDRDLLENTFLSGNQAMSNKSSRRKPKRPAPEVPKKENDSITENNVSLDAKEQKQDNSKRMCGMLSFINN